MKSLVLDTYRTFSRHDGTLLSGAAAYFALLSSAPLLLLVLAVAGALTSESAARGELMHGLQQWLGVEGARTLASALDNVRASGSSRAASAVGVAIAIYGSTRLFHQAQAALNHMWGVRARTASGWKHKTWKYLRRRMLAFATVMLCALFLLLTVLVRAGLTAANGVLGPAVPFHWDLIDFCVTYSVVTLLFAFIYKVLPDVKLAWRDGWRGAAATSILFMVGKTIVGVYLGHKSLASTFGAAGSLVLLLLWAYYTAFIFFMGAALTGVLARRAGRPLVPTGNAVVVEVREDGK